MNFDFEALRREAHVRTVELAAARPAIETVYAMLAQSERARADRYRFGQHRDAFVLARGALRLLVGGYLRTAAERVVFEYGTQGKPSLAWPKSSLSFNLSHAGGLAAYAFTVNRDIGIDIERTARTLDFEGVAKRFFGPAEFADLLSVPESERPDAFFRCWVRKESYIKALGGGLFIPLDSFRVTLLPGEPPAIAGSDWTIHAFRPAPGYDGAVCLRDAECAVRVHPIMSAEEIFARATLDT